MMKTAKATRPELPRGPRVPERRADALLPSRPTPAKKTSVLVMGVGAFAHSTYALLKVIRAVGVQCLLVAQKLLPTDIPRMGILADNWPVSQLELCPPSFRDRMNRRPICRWGPGRPMSFWTRWRTLVFPGTPHPFARRDALGNRPARTGGHLALVAAPP